MIERSSSPRSFPIVIIEKKNSLAVPLPLIDDILALLGKTAYFSTLDLRSGYWQVSLDEPGWEKTVICLTFGGYLISGWCPLGCHMCRECLPNWYRFEWNSGFAMVYLNDVAFFFPGHERSILNTSWGHFKRFRENRFKLKLLNANVTFFFLFIYFFCFVDMTFHQIFMRKKRQR